jgi:alginate O-acetyltransferase complex protein AlgI
MVFSSFLFLFRFLPAVLLIYYVAPRRFRNFILLAASLLFYAWGEPVYVVLLLFSSVLDYTMGRLIGHFRSACRTTPAKICLAVSLCGNLLLLGVFKYADFLISTLNGITGMDVGLLELALPIGISFYTFQTLSYTIDVYRGKVAPQHNFITFASYVALFPQLIAGPIVRYQTVEQELSGRKENFSDFSGGVLRFVTGLAKKVLVANNVGALFSEIAAMSGAELSACTAWLGVLAFTFQIYFDFSGYSDMAIGLGRMFGFHFLENFEHPYESESITEFWRRWHISLGTWFKEYVYIPLGGNRKGLGRQLFNIAIVWFLTGLWHGASWNFVLWGVYYGLLLVLEKCFLLRVLERLPAIVRHIYTMVFVVGGWAFFCYSDLSFGADFVGALFGQAENGVADSRFLYLLVTHLVLLLIAAVGSTTLPVHLATRCLRAIKTERTRRIVASCATGIFTLACLLLSIAWLVSDSYNPFLYFRF